MDNDNKLKYANDLIASCLLPELVTDIGENLLEPKHFDEFRKVLNEQLTNLFDFIQKHEDLIFEINSHTLEIRCKLIILLCEQTFSNPLYQTKNIKLLHHLHTLIGRYFTILLNQDPKLESQVFKYYKEKLQAKKWKKELGATQGFINFLQLRYSKEGKDLLIEECTFILSVGLLLRDFYDPSFKEYSYIIFNILLLKGSKEYLKSVNIHNVIYEAIILDVSKIESYNGTRNLWNCFLYCIDVTECYDFSKWNQVDDLIENAIKRITFAPNFDVRYYLYLFLSKLVVRFSLNKEKILQYLETEELNWLIENGRNLCSEITSYASYKWAKKLLKLFISETNYLLGGGCITAKLLSVMHVCYLTCIVPIPISILQPHLIDFLDKFISVLAEVFRDNKVQVEIKKGVKEFLQTFLYLMADYTGKDNAIISNKKAIEKILAEIKDFY